jgi:hypothetical protein
MPLVGLVALAGCHRIFECESDEQCRLDGGVGRCEAAGFCSFADDACASGRRWGEHAAASFADECVDAPSESTSGAQPGAETGATGAATSTAETGATADSGDCPPLVDAAPMVVTEDGAVIERVRIESDGEPAIRIEGASGVTVRDVEIHHRGAPGLVFAGSNDLHVSDVIVVHDGAPESGPHATGDQANIEGRDATGVVLERIRVVRGSSGIDLESTPAAQLSFIAGEDVRGPGAAAFVRLHESDDAILEDFSIVNPLETGRPQTLVQVSASSDVIVRRGLLDGHNAQYGYGIGFDQTPGQHSGGLVEDVDALRMTNGAFTCFPWGSSITYRRTRARDNICEILSVPIDDCDKPGPNGGCIPGSNGVMWSASTDSVDVAIEDSTEFQLCFDSVWPVEVFSIDLVEADFVPRDPIDIAPCWAS